MLKITLLVLQSISAINLGQHQRGSLLTADMFDDVNPDEFKKQLDSGEQKTSSFAATADGVVDAKTVDTSNWNDAKKADCYFKGFNNVVPDGLMHLSDGTSINCEDGRKVDAADF